MMDINIRDWTFTHWWVRPTVKVWFDLYHKTITYSGIEHIDWQKPIIFAPSHQNAFTDALCLILPTKYTNDRFIYPLIRADAFGNNRAMDWMLTTFHMLPVYRPRDKVNLKKRNRSVFSHCHRILFKKRNLLIHPEGNCIPRKNVRPFKKGLSRIALGAEAKKNFELGVNVIPVGINYRAITEARKGIHIRFGSPVLVSDFEEQYKESQPAAISDLTKTVEAGVKKVTVDIDTRNYNLTEQLIRLLKNNDPQIDTRDYDDREFQIEKDLIAGLRKEELRDPDLTEQLDQSFRQLTALADQNKLDMNRPMEERKSTTRLAMEGAGYLIMMPIIIYGWIINILPWILMHKVSNNIKEKQFKNSARMVAGLLLFPLSYLVQTAILGIAIGFDFGVLAYLISLPVTGVLALKAGENMKSWLQQLRLKRISDREKQQLSQLLNSISVRINKGGQPEKSALSSDAV